MVKVKKRKEQKYTSEELEKALAAVKTGKSLGEVSKLFNIPKTTLYEKNAGLSAPKIVKKGPPCVLGEIEEAKLVHWIISMGKRGFPVSRVQLLDSVQLLLKARKQKTVFTQNRPGAQWYKAFLQRHPELRERLSQNLTANRVAVTEEKIRGWFETTRKYLEEKNVLTIHPSRVFNCDETAIQLCPPGNSVLTKRGDKTAYNFVKNNDKECQTVLFCGNADGKLVEPMIMFNYARIPPRIASLMPKGWGIGRSENGWMTGVSFYEWTTNIFYPWLVTNQIEFPVILFVDGHSSHLTLELSNFCREHKIELIALYPNSTHILQPMDVAVFRPLKASWKKVVPQWRLENNGERLKKDEFSMVLKRAVDSLNWASILPNGFRTTGLHPFTPDGINFERHFKTTTEKSPVVDSPSDPKIEMSFLESFESQMDADILRQFKLAANDEEWAGDLAHKSFFKFWRKVKSQTNEISLTEKPSDIAEHFDMLQNNDGIFVFNVCPNGDLQLVEDIGQNDSMGVSSDSNVDINPSVTFNVGGDQEDIDNIKIISSEAVTDNAPELSSDCECGKGNSVLLDVSNLPKDQFGEAGMALEIQESNRSKSLRKTTPSPSPNINEVKIPIAESSPIKSGTTDESLSKNIPSPFKGTIYWPSAPKKPIKRTRCKEQLPSAITSDTWNRYYKDKVEKAKIQKNEMEQKKQQKILKREAQKQEKEAARIARMIKKEKKMEEEAKKKSPKVLAKSGRKRNCFEDQMKGKVAIVAKKIKKEGIDSCEDKRTSKSLPKNRMSTRKSKNNK